MEKTNSVHLEGHVGSVFILSRDENRTVAGLQFYTFIPKEGAPKTGKPSERFDYMRHKVRVTAVGPDGDRLLEIERICAADPGIHPYELKGVLRDLPDGSNLVDCRIEDLKPTRSIQTNPELNNVAKIAGSVVSTTYSDRFAKVLIDTGQGNVSVFFPKETFGEAWEAVSKGRMKKGTMLAIEGPLLSQEFTDGKSRFLVSVVTPHVMQQEKLTKRRRQGAMHKVG